MQDKTWNEGPRSADRSPANLLQLTGACSFASWELGSGWKGSGGVCGGKVISSHQALHIEIKQRVQEQRAMKGTC